MSKPVAAAVDDETDESFERIFGSMGVNIEEARLVGLLSSWPKGEKRQKKMREHLLILRLERRSSGFTSIFTSKSTRHLLVVNNHVS